MSIIVIEDLSENIDLDRQAMRAIAGGARTSGRKALVQSKCAAIVNYSGGITSKAAKIVTEQRVRGSSPK